MFISKSMCPGSSKAATGISFRDKSNLQKASKTLTQTTANGCQQLQERPFQYNPMAIDQLQVQWFNRLRLLMFWEAKGMENWPEWTLRETCGTSLGRQADRLHAGPNDVTWCLSKGRPLAVQRHASNTWCWRCHTTLWHEHEFIDRCCLATWDTGRYKYWFLICPSGGKMWIWFSGVWKCKQGSILWMAANTTPALQSSSARGLLQVTVCQPVQNKQVPMLLGDKTINN